MIDISNTISIGSRDNGINWSSYWTTLISATVENAAPTHVVLTFPTAQTSLGATDFTIAGFTISSASWTGAVLTLVLSSAVIQYNGNLTITFVPTSETGTVTNNVSDGKTSVWYDMGDGSSTYVTKDGSDFVSVWKDLSGNNRPLNQAIGTNQPKWESDGILFDGVDNFLKASAFTNNQPLYYYAVLNEVVWGGSYIWDGNATATIVLYPKAPTINRINMFAGADITGSVIAGSFHILRCLYNGANSKYYVDTTLTTGNVGANNAGGLTIGSTATGTAFNNVKFKELIIRNNVDDAGTETAIYNYLKAKYSL